MIELITGLPGNGKSLYTIGEVKRRAEAEGRPVYCSGFTDLQLDWTQIDATKWMDVPAGSIVVIDECQKIFRNRSMGAQPPVHVTALEEHRHKGLDFYLVTQHPSLIDPAIRRLTQTHKHMIRIFGMEASTVHKWNGCTPNPDVNSARASSEKTRWAFDKSLYSLYKSAEVHTMKRSIPLRLKLLLLVPLALAGAVYVVKMNTVDKHKPPPAAVVAVPLDAAGNPMPALSQNRGPQGQGNEPFDPIKDAERFVQMNTPRVEGLAYTAPKYDEITKPVRAPIPAMCVQMGVVGGEEPVRCKCYSQQGTPLDVPFNMCMGFARDGWFKDFNEDADRQQMANREQGEKVMEGRTGVLENREPAGQVAMFQHPPREAPYVPQTSGRPSGG